jgi:multidrug resistance efflux pump
MRTADQHRAYALADNKIALNATWDEQLLAEELKSLSEIDISFDLDITGFSVAEFDSLIEDLTAEEPNDPNDDRLAPNDLDPRCRPGDLWRLGPHRLLCGNALDSAVIAVLMANEEARMVFTGPPYNVPIDGHVGGSGAIKHREFAMACSEMTAAEFTEFLEAAFRNLVAFSVDGSIHFVCMDWRHVANILDAGRTTFMELKNLIVWGKDNGGLGTWDAYMAAPWTRDATVRTYVVTIAPEVAGRIVQLPVRDNQFVHKGDLLLVIDPTDYKNALQLAEANVEQARANALNAQLELQRRQKLTELAETVEDRQIHEASAAASQAQYRAAQVSRDQAKVNLERTQLRSPVNGWITNLLTQVGDYASVGRNVISVVDADSFWIDAYFEETRLPFIREGDIAKIKLMGHSEIILGEVSGLARGITVANAQPDPAGLANVNPIFTWVRLAQRIPVRIDIKRVPDGVRLVTGLTATVQVESRSPSSTR